MSMIHGKTSAGRVIPVQVDANGRLALASVTVEASFGGKPEHWDGTAGAAPATVTFSDTTRSIMIDNTGDTNDLLFSLDGGTKFKTLPPESSISIACDRADMEVKTAGAPTTTYEIVAVVAE